MNWWRQERGFNNISLLYHTADGKKVAGIINIAVDSDGSVNMTEECDMYYSATYTSNEAICALQEAIDFIRSKANG